jgi:hypothetical protein
MTKNININQLAINILVTLLTLSLVTPSFADTITGTLNFIKKPAKAGVIYEVKSSFDKVVGTINQENKKFIETIGVTSYQGELKLNNNDKFEHNIFANDLKQDIKFDIGLMSPGSSQRITADWKSNSIVRIGCKIHPKMRSYVANIPSDNFNSFELKKKDKTYSFELANVTEDKLVLLLAGMDNIEISLAKGESKTFDIVRKNKPKGQLLISRN